VIALFFDRQELEWGGLLAKIVHHGSVLVELHLFPDYLYNVCVVHGIRETTNPAEHIP
jgi:hypothetical protein